jgi:formylglycine-generating enzyme
MRILTVVIVLFSATSVAAAPAAKPLVAIGDVQQKGIVKPAVAAVLRQHLESQVLATGLYTLVEAEKVREKLREVEGGCRKAACLIDVGKALGAAQVLELAISRKGARCGLAGVLHDVRRGAAVRSGTARGRCEERGLRAAIDTVVAKIAGTFTRNDTEPMVLIPAGEFQRGLDNREHRCDFCCKNGPFSDEPRRRIYLDEFYIDKHEVTVSQYRRCVQAGACTIPKDADDNYKAARRDTFPVNAVAWKQAQAYCRWAGKRLPTEAEWEKAARGTDGRRYPWGNEQPSCDRTIMAYNPSRYLPPRPFTPTKKGPGCGRGTAWPVGSRSPVGDSPYGVQDMAGNVAEWVSDWYQFSYYKASSRWNPRGPAKGDGKVNRGSSFLDDGGGSDSSRGPNCDSFMTTARGGADAADAWFGFRCAMTP